MQKEAFGKLLVILRKKNGLSQKELAERLSVSTSAVSKWENGKITSVSAANIFSVIGYSFSFENRFIGVLRMLRAASSYFCISLIAMPLFCAAMSMISLS